MLSASKVLLNCDLAINAIRYYQHYIRLPYFFILFILIKSRQKSTYLKTFNIIKSMRGMIDRLLQNLFFPFFCPKKGYPLADFFGCNFYLSQAIFGKMHSYDQNTLFELPMFLKNILKGYQF